MINVVPFKKIVNKTRIKNSIFCHFEKIYRKNNNCRVAMTTTYESTSCNSENLVACCQLVARGCCMHVFLVSYIREKLYKNKSDCLWTQVVLLFVNAARYMGDRDASLQEYCFFLDLSGNFKFFGGIPLNTPVSRHCL